MKANKFQKQLFVNLDINNEVLYDAISRGRSAEDIALVYQYLTGNMDPIPNQVEDNGVLYTLKAFNPFTLKVECKYPAEVKMYFKTEEDAVKYAGTEDICKDSSLYKDKRFPYGTTVIRMHHAEISYHRWMLLAENTCPPSRSF